MVLSWRNEVVAFGRYANLVRFTLLALLAALLAPVGPAAAQDLSPATNFPDGTIVRFKADNGAYLSVCNGCVPLDDSLRGITSNAATVHERDGSSPYTHFRLDRFSNGYRLTSVATGEMMIWCGGCVDLRPAPDLDKASGRNVLVNWVKFAVFVKGGEGEREIPDRGDLFFLLPHPSGKYRISPGGGFTLLRCTRCAVGSAVSDNAAFAGLDPVPTNALWQIEAVNAAVPAQAAAPPAPPRSMPAPAVPPLRAASTPAAGGTPFATGTIVRLKTGNGYYLSVCNGCASLTPSAAGRITSIATVHMTDGSSPYTQFKVTDMGAGYVRLTSVANGEDLLSCTGCVAGVAGADSKSGGTPMLLFSPVAGSVSGNLVNQFHPSSIGGGRFTLAGKHGGYVTQCGGCVPGATKPAQVAMMVDGDTRAGGQWLVEVVPPATAAAVTTPAPVAAAPARTAAAAPPRAPAPAVKMLPAPAQPGTRLPTAPARGPSGQALPYHIDLTPTAPPPPPPSAAAIRGVPTAFREGTVITLRSDTGAYLSPCGDCVSIAPWIAGAVSDVASLRATGDSDPAAQFRVENLGGGLMSLVSVATGEALFHCANCVKGATTPDALALADAPPTGTDVFYVTRLPSGRYALQADNGNYVARCRGCVRGARAADQVTAHLGDAGAGYAQWTIAEVAPSRVAAPPPADMDDGPLPHEIDDGPPPPADVPEASETDGYEALSDDFVWSGSAEDHSLTLSRPETDDVVWHATCAGRTANNYVLVMPEGLKFGDLTLIRLRVDDGETFTLPAKIMPLPFGGDGGLAPLLNLSLDGPEMRAMANGGVAYLAVGQDPANTVRVALPLHNALNAMTAFSQGCR